MEKMTYPAMTLFNPVSSPITPAGGNPVKPEPGAFFTASTEDALRSAFEATFNYDGYQVVHREFFAHRFDPSITIRTGSIAFNNACISRLDDVVYVQLLVNPEREKLVIRPCGEDDRDALRWCMVKSDQRKSRTISCGLFTAKLFELMGWEAMYRYKLLGAKINHQSERLYLFDLTSTEVYLPQSREPDENGVKPKARSPIYPVNWRDSFGLPIMDHAASTHIDLFEGYALYDAKGGNQDA